MKILRIRLAEIPNRAWINWTRHYLNSDERGYRPRFWVETTKLFGAINIKSNPNDSNLTDWFEIEEKDWLMFLMRFS